MKKIHRNNFVISCLVLFLALLVYSMAENVVAQTSPQTDTVVVTLDVTSGITISDGQAVTMAPLLSIAVNSSIGSSTWTVITNGVAGYSLSVHDTTDPALRHINFATNGFAFANYTEGTPGTPEQPWTVSGGTKEFGFSAYGTDSDTSIWGLAQSCGVAGSGVPSATQKYMGFLATPTNKTIATRATVTPVTGITTTICFAAQQNAVFAPSGTYTATIIGTATTL